MDDSVSFNQSLYKHWITDQVRFGDLDPLGHVNNNAIGQYFENARAFLFKEVTPAWPKGDELFILARTSIDFRRELHLPAALKVGSRVLKLGRTSMILGNGLFDGDRGVALSAMRRASPSHCRTLCAPASKNIPKNIVRLLPLDKFWAWD
jgi:acyl-CoA thioester hydrolase